MGQFTVQHCATTKPSSSTVVRWLAEALEVEEGSLSVAHEQKNPSSIHWIVNQAIGKGAQRRIFVKNHALQLLYRQERDALTALVDYGTEDEKYAVPRILASSDALHCIALEWIEGEPIGNAMRAAVGRFAPASVRERGVETAYKVGSWLSHLRARTAQSPTAPPREEMRARFRDLVTTIETRFPRLLPNGPRLLEAFERELEAARPETNCLVHNDFWFDHIWFRRDQIVVLDFGRARTGPAGRDAVQFHCRLVDMAALNPLVSGIASREVVQAFLTGYGPLDFADSMNRAWQLWTRAEQLAGFVDYVRARPGFLGGDWLRLRALARQLLISASR